MSVQNLQQEMLKEECLQQIKDYIILGWPLNRNKILQDQRQYWTIKDDLAVIDGIIMEDRFIIFTQAFQKQAPKQRQSNGIGIAKRCPNPWIELLE